MTHAAAAIALLGLFLLGTGAKLALEGPCRDARDLRPRLDEPSGVAYHPERRTLFAVGDEGDVCELTLEGETLQERRIGGDLEGITIGPGGRLIVAVEGAARGGETPPRTPPAAGAPALLFLDAATLAVERRVVIDTVLEGKPVICITRGAGIEGLAWVPSLRKLFIVNQHTPARILEVAVPDGPGEARITRIVAELSEGVECASDLVWWEERRAFLVTASSFLRPDGTFRRGKLWEVTLEGKVVRSFEIPGKDQEGFCVDGAGCAYVACDSGGILKIEPARVGD